MKKLILFFLAGTLFSCNTASTSTEPPKDSTASITPAPIINYPYTINHPDNWEMGSNANTLVALNALKAWEQGKMDESVSYFGDSIHVQFDGLDKNLSRDSLKSMFTAVWKNFKNVNIKMDDWESVVSKDKQYEWVTVWYTQHWETSKGGKDSSAIINDMQLKNGKIIQLDEYTRKLH